MTDDNRDAIMELVLEGKKLAAMRLLQSGDNLSLLVASREIERIEDDLDLMEVVECVSCGGAGTIRQRKPEYRVGAESVAADSGGSNG